VAEFLPKSGQEWAAQARVVTEPELPQAVQVPIVAVPITAPIFAPLSSCLSDLPPLTYVGRINCVTGYGVAARHQIHVLRRHGARFAVVDAGSASAPDPEGRDQFIQAARRSDANAEPTRGTIFHIAPNMVSSWKQRDMPRPHILVSVWETTRLPAEWVSTVNGFDQVWCATDWQRGVYRDSGVEERLLRVVPFAIDPSLYASASTKTAGRTVFGSVFQWTERKAPAALIGAYLQAFTAADPVTLVLKSYEGDNPHGGVEGHVAAIVRSFRLRSEPPEIRVVTRSLTSGEMLAFYQSIDCYVSAHRGEGFGFPIAEALLSGRPVIATGWSAPAEFAAGCFRAVRYTLEPPRDMSWQPFYSIDQSWAHIDGADLVRAMRDAHAKKLQYSWERVRDTFAVLTNRAGAAAREALKEIL
jgi:glycosyltransferase involved in cell wall biosynthesis